MSKVKCEWKQQIVANGISFWAGPKAEMELREEKNPKSSTLQGSL